MTTSPGAAGPGAVLPPFGEALAAAFPQLVGQASLPRWMFEVESLRSVRRVRERLDAPA